MFTYMKQHQLIVISNRGYVYKNVYPSFSVRDVYWQSSYDQLSFVVNGADPKSKIKHIIDCSKHFNEK